MTTSWSEKWKPNKSSDIIGNLASIKRIKKWLIDFDKSKFSSLIISGNHGIGKTLTINILLNELDYNYNVIYPNEIKNLRVCDNFNDYFNYDNSIYSKMSLSNCKKKKKIALVFDEIESISLTSEKKYILNIFKENNKKKNIPLIFISNNKHSKLSNDLRKYSLQERFYSPSSNEIKKFVKVICKNENIIIEEDKVFNKIISFSQFDIRRLLNILEELSYHYSNKKISFKNLENFIKRSREKNEDIGLFNATSKLFNKYYNYDEIFKLYESEKVLLPLSIHENYKKKILNGNKSWEEKLFQIVKISDSLSRGDNIETSIYTDQNWYLQNIHGFYSCLNTSYWINKFDDKDFDSSNVKFSSDLNKTSLKNINKKNINNLLSYIPKKSVEEILIINKIFNGVIFSNKIRKLIKKLITYSRDISIKEVELCLKIDKTVKFAELSTKEKKIIQNLIKEIILENDLKKVISKNKNYTKKELSDIINSKIKVEEDKLNLRIKNNEKNVDKSYQSILKIILDSYK
jgi:replication factor C subunit 1